MHRKNIIPTTRKAQLISLRVTSFQSCDSLLGSSTFHSPEGIFHQRIKHNIAYLQECYAVALQHASSNTAMHQINPPQTHDQKTVKKRPCYPENTMVKTQGPTLLRTRKNALSSNEMDPTLWILLVSVDGMIQHPCFPAKTRRAPILTLFVICN